MQNIELNGTKHPVKFGMREVTAFSRAMGQNSAGVPTIDADALIETALAAIRKGYRKSEKKLPDYIDAEWLEDEIDEDPEAAEKISSAVMQSKYGQHLSAKANQPDTEEKN